MRKLSYVGGEKGLITIGYFTNSALVGSVTSTFQKMGCTVKSQDLKLYFNLNEGMDWKPEDGDIVRYYQVPHDRVGLIIDKWTQKGAKSVEIKHILGNCCIDPEGNRIETYSGPIDIWMFTIHSE